MSSIDLIDGDTEPTGSPGRSAPPLGTQPSPDRKARSTTSSVSSVLATAADRTADVIDRHLWIVSLARVGWLAKALVYGIMGWVTLLVALDRPTSTDVSYTGAVEELARRPASRATLLILATGLILYVLWRMMTILLIDGTSLDCWAHRLGWTVSAFTYAAIAWIAVRVAFDSADPEPDPVVEDASRQLLEGTLGRWVLGVSGAGALMVAGYFFFKGLNRRFLRELDLGEVDQWRRLFLEWTGAVGWLGRCLIVMVVGGFVTWAAIDADPFDARGLDSAIQRLAVDDLGSALAGTTGALLLIYAVFCAVSAPRRKVKVPL